MHNDNFEIPWDEQMLEDSAEMSLALAKLICERMMAAEDAQKAASLRRAYHSLVSSTRASMALQAKLQRARRQEARRAAPPMTASPYRGRYH